MATIAWPLVPTTTILSVCSPAVFQPVRKSVDRASNERRYVFTVVTYFPSTKTWAWPRVGPVGPFQATFGR